MFSMLYALVLSAIFLCSTLPGQGWSWQLSPAPGGSPPNPVMASSAQHRLTLIIANDVGTFWNGASKNGSISIPRRPNDGGTLVFDESRGQWLHFEFGRTRLIDGAGKVTDLQISGTQRTGLGPAVYDPARREVIGTNLGRIFTLRGTTWKEESIPGPYSGPFWPRDAAMCYWPTTQTVIWQGYATTWEWNGLSWRKLMTKSAPPGRIGGWLVYDPTAGVAWYGGGYDQVASLRDLWTFDGREWTQIAVSCPFEDNTVILAAAFDHATQQVISFDHRGRVWRLVQGHPANVEAFELRQFVCKGSTSLQAVAPNDAPRLGTVFDTRTDPVPSGSAAIFMLGASMPPGGGIGLNHTGAPACHVLLIPVLYAARLEMNGSAHYSLPIPNDTGLLCNYFYLQAIVVNLNANALGLVTSNGLMCHIGR